MIVLKITYLGNDHDLTWKGGVGGQFWNIAPKHWIYTQGLGASEKKNTI